MCDIEVPTLTDACVMAGRPDGGCRVSRLPLRAVSEEVPPTKETGEASAWKNGSAPAHTCSQPATYDLGLIVQWGLGIAIRL